MRLGIISDAHHYYDQSGCLCTLTLLARQFEQWAGLFEDVTICAPLIAGTPPKTHTPYVAGNIHLLPVTVAGGNTLSAKIHLLVKLSEWRTALHELLQQVDAVHIRCPNNISILGLLALHRTRLLRQAVYTGSWLGHNHEGLTYKAQRIFLKYFFRGPVAVYGTWPNQPDHIVPSFSPSYTQADWDMESVQIADRLKALHRMDRLPSPIHLLSVGALNRNKNQRLIIEALVHLVNQGVDCRLDLLGDGDQRITLEDQVQALGLTERVIFHGAVAQSMVRQFYRRASFVIQAPYSEGFGKVPIEAFFHGVIPILSDVDMSSQITGMGERGSCFHQDDAQGLARLVVDLAQNPASMARMIENGRKYVLNLTIEAWQQHLCKMLNHYWKTQLAIPQSRSEN